MQSTIFTQTLWRPGELLDPTSLTAAPLELTQRLMHLEKALDQLQVGDLPISDLERQLEQTWQPDPSTLFPAGSVGNEVQAYSTYYGQVGGAAPGTILIAGSGDWSVVRNGAGDYTITFAQLKNVPIVTGTPQANVTGFRVSVKTVATARFLMSADSDFDFVVIGK